MCTLYLSVLHSLVALFLSLFIHAGYFLPFLSVLAALLPSPNQSTLVHPKLNINDTCLKNQDCLAPETWHMALGSLWPFFEKCLLAIQGRFQKSPGSHTSSAPLQKRCEHQMAPLLYWLQSTSNDILHVTIGFLGNIIFLPSLHVKIKHIIIAMGQRWAKHQRRCVCLLPAPVLSLRCFRVKNEPLSPTYFGSQ